MVFSALDLAFSVAARGLTRVYAAAPIAFVMAAAVIWAVASSTNVKVAAGINMVG